MLPGHVTSGADEGSQRPKQETTLHPSTGGDSRGARASRHCAQPCEGTEVPTRTAARVENRGQARGPPRDPARGDALEGKFWRRRQSRGTEGHEGHAQRGAWGEPSHCRRLPKSLSHMHARRVLCDMQTVPRQNGRKKSRPAPSPWPGRPSRAGRTL